MATSAQIQARIDRLEEAISQGSKEVEFTDGRRVVYRTIPEAIQALNYLKQQLGETIGRQRLLAKFSKGTAP